VARQFQAEKRIRYSSIPHFPRPTVAGHGGTLHLGRWGKASVAVLEGRMHLYEGYSPAEVAFPVRVLALSGAETLIFTCAAGGIAPQAAPGTFMLFSDHLNFQGVSPLAGPHDERWGARFVELGRAYDALLQRRARKACSDLGLDFFQGVYAAVLGPNYETPSEIRALRRAGADAVGMSTVPEVLAARQSGVRVLAVAVITNRAAGLSPRPLSHEEVLKVGRLAARDLGRFLEALLRDWSR